MDGEDSKFKASDWKEVKELYELLLNEEFEKIKTKIK